MRALLKRHSLWWIVCGALMLRFGLAVGVQTRMDRIPGEKFLIAGDADGYWELGRRLATGEEYALYDPPRRVMRMPGFPAILAVSIRLFGESVFAARLVLAAVGALACFPAYWLGKELFDRSVGLWAAGLIAMSPVMAGFSVLILSETLFGLALLVSLAALARLIPVVGGTREKCGSVPATEVEPRRRGLFWGAVAGMAIGAACLVRPSWLLAAPLFVGIDLVRHRFGRDAWIRGGALLMGTVLVLAPWTIRNDRVTGHWVMTTLWMGPSLYDGLNPEATGDSNMEFFERDRVLESMSEYEMDRHYRRLAWEFVRENPGRTAELAVVKWGRYWKPWPNADQFAHPGLRLLVAATFLPLFGLAALGTWHYRRHFWALVLTVGPILYFAVLHSLFVGSLRYRLPAEYALAVMAAAGLQWFLQWLWKSKDAEP